MIAGVVYKQSRVWCTAKVTSSIGDDSRLLESLMSRLWKLGGG